eukprot:2186816-Pyramimonas_sp.AAC.1
MASFIADGIAEIFRERWKSKPPRVHWMKFSVDERDADHIGRFIKQRRLDYAKFTKGQDCKTTLCATHVYQRICCGLAVGTIAKQLLSRMQ